MKRTALDLFFLALCAVAFAANVVLLAVNLSLTVQHVADPAWVTVGSLSAFGLAVAAGVGVIAMGGRSS